MAFSSKKISIIKPFCFFLAALFVAVLPLEAADKGFDHSAWDAFVKKYVNEKGEVDYRAVQKDPALLNAYFDALATKVPANFSQIWPREEKIAFWMNAYNAGVIKLIVQHYPVKNIQLIPSASDITIVAVGDGDMYKRQYSLNNIRQEKLIQNFRDEKIHLALSCGAQSCPKLQRRAFTGRNVEGQLFLATRSFVSDPQNVEVIPGKKKIGLSRIFKWYAKDFNLDFGTPEKIGKFTQDQTAVLSFLAYYLDNEAQITFLEGGRYKIKYLPFDWRLNDWTEHISKELRPPEEGAALPSTPSQVLSSEKA